MNTTDNATVTTVVNPNTGTSHKRQKLTAEQRKAMVDAAMAKKAAEQPAPAEKVEETTQPVASPAPQTEAPQPTPSAKVGNPKKLVRYAPKGEVPTDPSTPCSFIQANPKMPGTKCHAAYEVYKVAKTIGEAKKLGATRDGLRWEAARGHVTFGV